MEMEKTYSVGRIYAIKSRNSDDVYIGSTSVKLEKRLNQHHTQKKRHSKGKASYSTSYKILEQGDVYIELIKEFNNITKKELLKHEGEVIRNTQCVNKNIAGRTDKEYRKMHYS